MGYCANCGNLIPTGQRSCPVCGTESRPAVCPDCGMVLRGEWVFCPRCRRRIEEPEEYIADSALPAEPQSDSESEELEALADEWEDWEAFTEPELLPEPKEEQTVRPEEEREYAELIARREALREELKAMDGRLERLKSSDEESGKLSPEERSRIGRERRELRAAQGRNHAELLEIAKELRKLADREADRGRQIFSREHPELDCPRCNSKLRRGVDTWPYCPCCGQDVTETEGAPQNTELIKLRCGERGLKRVWYTGDRDFYECWSALCARHRRHEYRYSANCAVLTAELSEDGGSFVRPVMPDGLPELVIILLRKSEDSSGGFDSFDGMRTDKLGMLDMSALSEAERYAFLRLLQTSEPDRECRRFNLI